MMDHSLELAFLRQEVEQRFGRRLSTTADFNRLSEELEDKLSASTLKRIWGYVGMKVEPRSATLDVLAVYAGFRDYKAFLEDLQTSRLASSGYFNAARLDAETLQAGDIVQIGWRPDRIVTLLYLGSHRFRVTASEHAKLQEGDEFDAATIVKGFPLIVPAVYRAGEKADAYIAGRDGGIVFIKMG